MRTEMIIHLETSDMARLDMIEEVYALIGGRGLPAEDQKAFGRVRGNAFSLQDLDAIAAAIEKATSQDNPVVFSNPKVQARHRIDTQNAWYRARQAFDLFMRHLEDELAAANDQQ